MEIKQFILETLLTTRRGAEIDSTNICLLINTKFNLEDNLSFSPIKLRGIINELRREEIPVIGNSRGYYISYKPEDITAAIVSLNGRIEGIQLAIGGLKHCLTNVINNIGIDNE
jgi:hypothetical protein